MQLTAFNVNTCHVLSNISQLFPLFDVDHLETANCYNLTIVFYPLGSFGQALCIRSCHEDLIVTRKSNNCAEIAFIQGDSAGGSKLSEQTLIAQQYYKQFGRHGVQNWYTSQTVFMVKPFKF